MRVFSSARAFVHVKLFLRNCPRGRDVWCGAKHMLASTKRVLLVWFYLVGSLLSPCAIAAAVPASRNVDSMATHAKQFPVHTSLFVIPHCVIMVSDNT